MIKRRVLPITYILCLFAALLVLSGLVFFTAYTNADIGALAEGEPNNVIRRSDNNAEPSSDDLNIGWTYGDDDIISYTFRPEHGDTAYYTVSDFASGEEKEKFAIVYIGNTAMLYAVQDGEADTETPFKVNSLNAYFKTLKAGKYSLAVSVPSGTAPASHTHWWDSAAGEKTCGIEYSGVALNATLTVAAYEFTQTNVGSSSSYAVQYSVKTREISYTGEANNVPEIELTFGGRVLVQDEDYTLSGSRVNIGDADLTITGIGGFTGSVTVANAYKIVKAENSVSDAYVIRWKYGEYDRKVNLFTANADLGSDELYFAIATDTTGSEDSFVEGLDDIRLTDGMVSPQVEQRLNKLDAKTIYYLYAKVDGNDNYFGDETYTPFDIVEVTNTWKTIPNVVSWEWHGFDENVNVINAVPAFGGSVKFRVYTKDDEDYTALEFGGQDYFELEDGEDGYKLPEDVAKVLSDLDAGTYYLFASVVSDTDNYSSINEEFSVDALVPFRVFKARNYWMQIPKISNWSYGAYNPEINVISAEAAHGSSNIRYRIYKQSSDGIGLLNFGGTTTFTLSSDGAIPTAVTEGLKVLGVGKYYLRAEVAETDNYTGLLETIADFSELPAFEVIKAENYWSAAPSINAWAEGKYSNDDNLPTATAHYGAVRIVIVDVNDEENVVYDSENGINNLSQAKVGAYLLTATVAGTDNYSELTFDTIFRVFVPETDNVGIPWWLVLIIVICSLGVLVFIFWLLHEKGVLQMLTSKMILTMRTKATMDATIAAIRATKVAEEAKESVRLAEELDRLEAEKAETEEDDSDDDGEAILISRDDVSGFATYVRYQRPFSVKLIQATDEAKNYYMLLKNVLLSYKKVKSKLSKGYDAFNRGRVQLAKLVIRGKTLCLYLALNPDDYADSKYKVERSESKKFAEVPCLYRIKSMRRLEYAEELIKELCDKHGIAQGDIPNVDYRPPYESTEQLLEKGLIKKVTYKKKIQATDIKVKDAAKRKGVKTKTEDESEQALQEAASTAPDEKSDN